jgi:5-methylcytosine-specific restriction endonuclease McrA
MSKYLNRVEKGLCGKCGKENNTNLKTCATCLAHERDRCKFRNAKGLCISCNTPIAQGGRCERCRENKKKKLIENKERYCSMCGKKFCVGLCFFAKLSRRLVGHEGLAHELKNKYDMQKGICPYSGRHLVLSENAHVDHIVPKSRGGTNDISNLQWVYSKCNLAKSNMLEDEFIALIKEIYMTVNKNE